MLAGKEASMDGATLFNRSARARGRCCHQGWPVAPSGCRAIWRGRQHSDPLGAALSHCGRADFTIRGLVAELAERGLKVDYRTVWEFVHAEKVSFKKKRGGWRTRAPRRGAAAGAMDKVSRSHRT